MVEKTYDATDPMDLPYRFAHCPNTGETFIISIGHGFNVLGYFENKMAFDRFLIEGNKTANLIAEPIPDTLKDIGGGA